MSRHDALALELTGVTRQFKQGERTLDVLRGVDLVVKPGEIVALLGPSGAGKSTLLHIAGLLEPPSAGQVFIGGRDASTAKDQARTQLRRDTIGFVYQFHHLLAEFTALENVLLPQLVAGESRREAGERANILLARLGLGERLDHFPSQLSGGEQQRVAIARALANRPLLLLADEPTGNLDERTADTVFAELLTLTRDEGAAAVIATHNSDLASRMDRRILLHEGRIEEK